MRYFVTVLLFLALSLSPVCRAEDKAASKDSKPIRALFVAGGCCHDYKTQKEILPKGISERANVVWTIAYDPDTTTKHLNPVYANADWARDFDIIVHDECSADVTDLKIIDRILAPHKEGLPAVVLHCGMHCYRSEGWSKDNPKAMTPWFEFTGLQTTGHGAKQPIAIAYMDKESPITKGLADWTTIDEELYNNIAGKVLDTAKPLAHGKQKVKDKKTGKETMNETVVTWTNTYNGKARVFGTTLGHQNDTVADARYLDLITRGLLWSTGHLTDDGKPAPGYEAAKK